MKTRAVLVASMVWLAGLLAAAELTGSPEARAEIVAVVQRFFDAMSAQDEAGMRQVFHPGSQFSLNKPSPSGITLSTQTIEQFAPRAATVKERYLERMWNPTVLINGRIAVVWGRYDFHVGKRFSHNGTDCFTLLQSDQGWKIVSLAFSVEPGERTEHPAGPP